MLPSVAGGTVFSTFKPARVGDLYRGGKLEYRKLLKSSKMNGSF
jgi:hypothetical protein